MGTALPPLAHRLNLLAEAGQLVRALADPDTSDELEQHLRETLAAVAAMCTAFFDRGSWEDLAQYEQERHPPGEERGAWWDAQGAMDVLSQMRESLLAPILAS
ncbi:hypothetical protein [Streptomyces chrestomyceticus]|uniref:hypothetical protein n=1 Tax=Streptomyces chrestomyceticus TaxID=68185 RepID=UPI0033F608F9